VRPSAGAAMVGACGAGEDSEESSEDRGEMGEKWRGWLGGSISTRGVHALFGSLLESDIAI
jgi:hypothetical protein